MNLRISRLGDFVFVDELLLSWRRQSMSVSNVSTRWRDAFVATRHRTISHARILEQRIAARFAVRRDMERLKETADMARQGKLPSAPKKLALVGLFAAVYTGLYRSNSS